MKQALSALLTFFILSIALSFVESIVLGTIIITISSLLAFIHVIYTIRIDKDKEYNMESFFGYTVWFTMWMGFSGTIIFFCSGQYFLVGVASPWSLAFISAMGYIEYKKIYDKIFND